MLKKFRRAALALTVLASSAALSAKAHAYAIFSSNDPASGLQVGAVDGLALNPNLSSFTLLTNPIADRQGALSTTPESYVSWGGHNTAGDVHELAANGISDGASPYTTAPISVDFRYTFKLSDVGTTGQIVNFEFNDTLYSELGKGTVAVYKNGGLIESVSFTSATDTTLSAFVNIGDQIDTVYGVGQSLDGSTYSGIGNAGTLIGYQGGINPVPEPASVALLLAALGAGALTGRGRNEAARPEKTTSNGLSSNLTA